MCLNSIEQSLYDYFMLNECEIRMVGFCSTSELLRVQNNIDVTHCYIVPLALRVKQSIQVKLLAKHLCGSITICNEQVLFNPVENIVYITGGLFNSYVAINLPSKFTQVLSRRILEGCYARQTN